MTAKVLEARPRRRKRRTRWRPILIRALVYGPILLGTFSLALTILRPPPLAERRAAFRASLCGKARKIMDRILLYRAGRALNLQEQGLGLVEIGLLIDTPGLLDDVEILRLNDNNIGDTGAARLAGCEKLRTLKVLDLRDNDIFEAGAKTLARSPVLTGLEELRFGCVSTKDQDRSQLSNTPGSELLAASPTIKSLRVLQLKLFESRPEDFRLLVDSESLSDLEVLSLRYSWIGDERACRLARSKAMPRLRSLDLIDNRLGVSACRSLAKASGFPELRSLLLAGNPWIGAEGALSIAETKAFPKLERLDLSQARMADKAWIALVKGGRFPKLHVLAADENFLSDAAIIALARSPLLRHLRRLDLSKNQFTDRGLEALLSSKNLPRLERLHIFGESVHRTRTDTTAKPPETRALRPEILAPTTAEKLSRRGPNLADLVSKTQGPGDKLFQYLPPPNPFRRALARPRNSA